MSCPVLISRLANSSCPLTSECTWRQPISCQGSSDRVAPKYLWSIEGVLEAEVGIGHFCAGLLLKYSQFSTLRKPNS